MRIAPTSATTQPTILVMILAFSLPEQLSGDDAGRIDEDCAQHEQECARLEQALRDLLEVVHTGVLSA